MREGDENVRARAMRAELGESSTGSEQIGIEFALLDQDGARMTWYGNFKSEKSTEIALKGMRAAGWRGLDVSDLSSLDCSVATTPEVVLVIGDDSYTKENGTTVTSRKIKFINSAGGLNMKKPLAGDGLKVFAAKMRGRVAMFDKATGAPVGGEPRPTGNDGPQPTPPFNPNEQPPPDDDDCPF